MAKSISISAVGHSEINRDPERAVVCFRVSQKDGNKTAVSNNVIQTANTVQEFLETYIPRLASGEATPDAAITHWTMGTLNTKSYTDRDEQKTMFEASTSFSATFRDFDKLGAVATTLSVMPNVSITSTRWMLTDATIASLISECRISAAHDARTKARDYAKAFGYQDVEPYEISDTSYGLPSTSTASVMRSRKMMRPMERQEQQLIFRPEEVSMTSTVTIKFNIV
ncbi:hypothetical protein RJZ56_006175 [Blastomyces dermatitidis]|uniref:SIMPL domain-containing protein n=3 Tax=Blastomyces TaxID=229219 RepID=A0A179UGQ9_BLAGS|nr:uncharacterized protein BDBG_03310 [Blastomyces gilchristii SLH14081]XP_045278816.1 uncharacterized protein BDCG_07627 [Blastomyces dermatitidis ER-3]EGE83527.1 hypothetical protein BDDG_06471 [Blastomyces dermatitidis ATCC 18188]EQL31568.1 hypothetical protein BDFG_06143 [Blastomyces dermatitidis ATCC 26199]EEQ92507.1 hypothetical protein BDCG_07627 [Blastomyces dermatitidis ER-3]OAT07226.1 hypothetical protein BDBG_03310 [Blastomyces gilchristii SLH14081]